MADRTTRIDPKVMAAMADRLPLGRDIASVRKRIEGMEHLLEGLVTIPGLNRKIGLDVILDFVPVAGDAVAAAMGGWLIWEARNVGMSRWQMTKMAGNVGIDFLLGLVPGIGIIPDFFFRSNTRNVRMIKRHLDKHHPASAVVDAKRG